MTETRRVTDLRDNYEEIIKEARETDNPLILEGDNGKSLILMSMDSYEKQRENFEISCLLREAEIKNKLNGEKGYTFEEAMAIVKNTVEG